MIWHQKSKITIQEKDAEYKYEVIHSTPKNGKRILWSNTKDNGFYKIEKVIFGDSGISDPIIDSNGKLLMSEHAMGIPIIKNNQCKICNALTSEKFQKFLRSCMWSNFQIDWRLFTYLKEDFYEYFIEE